MAAAVEGGCGGGPERLRALLRDVAAAALAGAAGAALLGWNEAREARVAGAVVEIEGAVELSATAPGIGHEGELVLVRGTAHADAALSDPDWGARTRGIALARLVRTYQWIERRERDARDSRGGGGARNLYRYRRVWDARQHDSSGYRDPERHANPPARVADETWRAARVTLGAFELGPELVGQLRASEPLAADGGTLARLPADWRRRTALHDGALRFRPTAGEAGFDPAAARIGDHEIRHRRLGDVAVSVLAARRGHLLLPYHTPRGRLVALLQPGRPSLATLAATLVRGARETSGVVRWAARALALGLFWLGAALGLRAGAAHRGLGPRPPRGRAGRAGLAAALGLALGVLVAAAAWLRVAPLFSAAAAVAAAALSVLLLRQGWRRVRT